MAAAKKSRGGSKAKAGKGIRVIDVRPGESEREAEAREELRPSDQPTLKQLNYLAGLLGEDADRVAYAERLLGRPGPFSRADYSTVIEAAKSEAKFRRAAEAAANAESDRNAKVADVAHRARIAALKTPGARKVSAAGAEAAANRAKADVHAPAQAAKQPARSTSAAWRKLTAQAGNTPEKREAVELVARLRQLMSFEEMARLVKSSAGHVYQMARGVRAGSEGQRAALRAKLETKPKAQPEAAGAIVVSRADARKLARVLRVRLEDLDGRQLTLRF